MEKVLIVANQFPPMGGSGVQRTSKFVKYLGDFGYEPVVLTRDARNVQLKDETLLKDIPEATQVVRTKNWDFTQWPGILALPGKVIARKLLIPDGERLWAAFSVKRAMQLIKQHQIKLMYTTSYPYSDHLLGLAVKKKAPHIKWVADFRDEWTNNPYTLDAPYHPWRTNMEKRMERQVLHRADAFISNTPVMCQNFVQINHLPPDSFTCIPNGYDIDDFEGLHQPKERLERFTITYVGSLYGRRKPDPFFEAMRQLHQENLIDLKKIQVRFIGNYKETELLALIRSYGIEEAVTVHSYMPHQQCLQKLVESDILLIIEGAGRGAKAFYTGKIFEYMNSNVPVLALLPEGGAAEQLMHQTRIGKSCDTNNIKGIKANFMAFYKDWMNQELTFAPDKVAIAQYERKALTGRLAALFDGVLDNG